MRVGGVVGVGASANIFIGMVEAPLCVRPYLQRMSRSELFTLMVCGMSTIAGTVLVLYASILQQAIPDALGHILAASLMSARAAISVAQLMVPQIGEPTDAGIVPLNEATSSMDAITRGTMVPERRDEIVSLGMKSILAGVMATCMTGAVVGCFY